jgi:Mlc titration factor MtfA (ptsG expression regulator)
VELLAEVGVARRKALRCLLKYSIIMDLSVVTVLPSLSKVGSWEEVLLFPMDFTVSQNWRD